jgi:hypothetical protein
LLLLWVPAAELLLCEYPSSGDCEALLLLLLILLWLPPQPRAETTFCTILFIEDNT